MELTLEQALRRAVDAHQAGRLSEAERLYRAILAAAPDQPDANHNLGQLALGASRPADALPLLKRALESRPQEGRFWLSYVEALIGAAQFDDAETVLSQGRSLGLSGPLVETLTETLEQNRSTLEPPQGRLEALVAAYGAGDLAVAESSASDLATRFPQHPLAWKVLGAIYQKQGLKTKALAAKQRVVGLAPGDAAAHANLAVALNHLERFAEAEASGLEALRLDRGLVQAHYSVAASLKAQGRLDEAEQRYRHTLALKPDYIDAYNGLGAVLLSQGRFPEAEAQFREAARYGPDNIDAFNNLGAALYKQGRLSEAEATYQTALRLDPTCAEAHNNLGVTLNDLGRLADAEASYRRALGLRPDYTAAHSNLLFGLNYIASLPPGEALAEAKLYGDRVSAGATPKFTQWLTNPSPAKLRIGLVSGDLRNHPVGYFLEALVRHLDPSRFDLLAFPTQGREDQLTARLKDRLHQWTPISGLSDLAAATAIHAAGVHVLLDLSGHTAHNRLPVFAYRPAPVQASWLGYFATTGLPEMDFFIGDPHMSPAQEHHHFSERVWTLAETWLCLAPPDCRVTREESQTSDEVTFGCLGNLAKVNEAVVDVWGAILRRVPNSRLLLKSGQFADPVVIAKVKGWFEARGVSSDRLILEGASPRTAYFETYNRVDLVLDTFPYPGGTTSVDALWMGTPVITLRGDRFLSRLGESIATNAGLVELIARDQGDYVDKAAALARDPERLARLRKDLHTRVLTTPLFDTQRFARAFEDALWGMWREVGLSRSS